MTSMNPPERAAMSPSASTVETLKLENAALKQQVTNLKNALQREKAMNVQASVAMEAEEERITNTLTKRLLDLKLEKEQLLMEVEREEELLTNTLQKQLFQVKQEKVDLENLLEQEQEYVVNRLQKQLAQVKREKDGLEAILQDNDDRMLELVQSGLRENFPQNVPHELSLTPDQERLLAQLHEKVASIEQRRNPRATADTAVLEQENVRLRHANGVLQDENFVLRQRLAIGDQHLSEVMSEKISLERDLEQEDERVFNNVTRRCSSGTISMCSPSHKLPSSSHSSSSLRTGRTSSVEDIMSEERHLVQTENLHDVDLDGCPVAESRNVPLTPTHSGMGESASRVPAVHKLCHHGKIPSRKLSVSSSDN